MIGGQGAITDFVEEYPISFNPKGSFYYMPYNTPMTAANLSTEDVILLDVFFHPVDQTAITILEPGYPSYDPPQYFYEAAFIAPGLAEQSISETNIDLKEKQFEVLGNVKNMRSTNISFELVEDSDFIDSSMTTAGNGTLASNALFLDIVQELNGIYFNSAAGNDSITGSFRNDFIRGGSGDDIITSLDGDDLIRGGSGADLIYGGSGADIFLYTFDQIDNSTDEIMDFDESSGDMLVVQNGIDIDFENNFVILNYSGFITRVDIGFDSGSLDSIMFVD